jgi:hypothetical protein
VNIHLFDDTTGEYLGTRPARDNPAFGEAGQPQYLLPRCATFTAPPTGAAQQAAVYAAGAWSLVPDYRGAVGYTANGQAVTITELGETRAELGLTAEPPPAAPPGLADFQAAIQGVLDATARTRHYDGILSACSYATSTNATFLAEAQACVAWRDAVWAYGYAQLALVTAGARPLPTVAELLAELPAIAWPA